MEEAEFDKPIYKLLASNDSGASAGHQAGMVIPKEFNDYFPQIAGKVSTAKPSIHVPIRAILFVENKQVGRIATSYQYQSWRGGRIERRITGNLGPLRDKSAEDDALIIERSLELSNLYRLTLLKKGGVAYNELIKKVGSKRWGVIDPLQPPVGESEIEAAEREQQKSQLKPFDMFDNKAAISETRTKRIARSRAFQRITTGLYAGKCAMCGFGLIARDGRAEVEAAHIVPRGKLGSDDARNGLSLCRAHHWAFDHGLWGVDAKGRIVLPGLDVKKGSNNALTPFAGKKLAAPSNPSLAPDAGALAWHLQNIVGV